MNSIQWMQLSFIGLLIALVLTFCQPAHARRLRIELGPATSPGIGQVETDRYRITPRVDFRPRGRVIAPRGWEAPPNGCEASGRGGFRIVSGAGAGACVGGVEPLD